MSIDLEKVLNHQFKPAPSVYDADDAILYALSIGAGADPVDPAELALVYELNGAGFKVFPTMAVTFPFTLFWQIVDVPGLSFNPMMLLHGEQYVELKQPLPPAAAFTNQARITNIYDKGSGALVILEVQTLDESGAEVAVNRSSLFVRGLGGFGGDRGPSSGQLNQPLDRAPDAIVQQKTQPNQALLYRLSSKDRNPLHADPQMAALGGFERPILHGLCTYGFAARAVMKQFGRDGKGGYDVARFKNMQARFSKHVFPGETLVTEMWQETDNRVVFQVKAAERDAVVLSNAAIELC
ncbi:MAG: MaoC family dehydratase N-terminal domain-containing protein [Ardenticatenaceae bacterium]|nr:MaoC family dehydratase N-terminal domain-containing protein [Ardenticatenaceae bacterium]